MTTERPTVVVVGAGLAGLTCAYRLADSAVDVILLEAQDRVGGRCWSSSGWLDNQVAEHGGELIESGQEHILRLVTELGLELEDRSSETGEGSLRMAGQNLSLSAVTGLPKVIERLRIELAEVGSPRYDLAGAAARALDESSIADWIDRNIEEGQGGRLGRAVGLAAALNLGFDLTQISAFALHQMFVGSLEPEGAEAGFIFGHAEPDQLPEYHETARAAMTEVLRVRGGNERIVSGLVKELPAGVLRTESPLDRLARRVDGRYEVQVSGDASVLIADRVVLALPLPCLRSVDLNSAGFSQRRHDAVDHAKMGQGTKLLLQLDTRLSRIESWAGFAITDEPCVALWDTSAGQPGDAGLLTMFTYGRVFDVGQSHAAATSTVLEQAGAVLREVAPGTERHLTGRGWVDSWPDDPWAQGSYAGFGRGQFTRFHGFLHLPEQGVHFAERHVDRFCRLHGWRHRVWESRSNGSAGLTRVDVSH